MVPEAGDESVAKPGIRPSSDAGFALAETVLAAELVDPATGVDDFLLARVERMTGRADLDCEVLTERAASRELVAATTGNFDIAVIGMDVGFHFGSS